MKSFDEYWATTGPWPDNILTAAFREVAQKAWKAGKASVGIKPGVLNALEDVISGIYGLHPGVPCPGVPCWLGFTELTPGQPSNLRPDVPEPPEGWTEHRARGCKSLHVDETCPERTVAPHPKEHCPMRLAGQRCLIHDVAAGLQKTECVPATPVVVCPGCLREIDPDTCGCGEAIAGHSLTANHGPIALGCDCFRSKARC